MSIANAKNGSAIENQAAQETTSQVPVHRPTTGLCQDPGTILAQIPDLAQKTTLEVPKKRLDGRIISQAISIKLVFGLGIGLVIGAILPFVFGKASRPSPVVRELPAWTSNGDFAGTASNTGLTTAPAWLPPPTAPVTAGVPQQTAPAPGPAILVPQQPQVGDTRTTAPTEPAWAPPRAAIAAGPAVAPSSAPNNYINPALANTNPPDNRGDYRGFNRDPRAVAPDSRNLQADNRNNAAAQYRTNDARYDYRGNAIETAPVRRDLPPGGYSRDPRYDNPANNYPPTGPGSPLMPSGASSPTPVYSDPRVSEPGVARFEGTVSTPPVRTSP